MSHPARHRHDDPVVARVRKLAMALPDAAEKLSHGCPTWFTTRVFASVGAHPAGDTATDRLDHALLFLPAPDEREALLAEGRFEVPAYVGHRGWLAHDLTRADVDWGEVAELVDGSYRQTAGVRRVARLDAAG